MSQSVAVGCAHSHPGGAEAQSAADASVEHHAERSEY